MGEIIEQIWNLPWYKVFCIAVIDDAILFVKLWPVWVCIIILAFVALWFINK